MDTSLLESYIRLALEEIEEDGPESREELDENSLGYDLGSGSSSYGDSLWGPTYSYGGPVLRPWRTDVNNTVGNRSRSRVKRRKKKKHQGRPWYMSM